MAEKDLKYFMRDNADEIVTVPGPDTFRDEEGNVINLQIKVLSANEIQKIMDAYKKKSVATDKRGNPLIANGEVVWKVEKNNTKSSAHIIAEALVYPDLKDPDLMAYYHCNDITEMPGLVFRSNAEYTQVSRAVMRTLGLLDDELDDDLIDEAKNS